VDIREKTSLLPGSCAASRHPAAVGVSPLTCASSVTGKASLTVRRVTDSEQIPYEQPCLHLEPGVGITTAMACSALSARTCRQ
jgi:hypothetical protein